MTNSSDIVDMLIDKVPALANLLVKGAQFARGGNG